MTNPPAPPQINQHPMTTRSKGRSLAIAKCSQSRRKSSTRDQRATSLPPKRRRVALKLNEDDERLQDLKHNPPGDGIMSPSTMSFSQSRLRKHRVVVRRNWGMSDGDRLSHFDPARSYGQVAKFTIKNARRQGTFVPNSEALAGLKQRRMITKSDKQPRTGHNLRYSKRKQWKRIFEEAFLTKFRSFEDEFLGQIR